MTDFSSFFVTGDNNPRKQVSVTRWNAMLEDTAAAIDAVAVSAAASVATRAAQAAIAATAGVTRYLAESGREGSFVFDASDLSALVAADTAQGLYVAPSSDDTGASGAWVRKFDGPISPLWFGLIDGDASGDNGAANSSALSAMLATLQARGVNASSQYQGLERVRFPAGWFEFASTIEITDGTLIFEGADTGSPGGRGTVLKFPAGVTGIRVHRYNTSGTITDGVTHRGGDGAIIRNFTLRGGFVSTEAEAHGIQLRARAVCEFNFIYEFEGDGYYGNATAGSGGATEGNANNSIIRGGRVQECRNGLFVDGADSNIWLIDGLDCSANRQWNFADSSFLGNTYVGCHSSSGGYVVGSSTPSTVSEGGNRYSCVVGQEAGASTNAPTGTTADNAWWLYIGAGGASAAVPAWLSGTTYRAGGSYHTDNLNADNTFVGCYHETGQGRSQIVRPSLIFGGTMAGGTRGTGISLFGDTLGMMTDRAIGVKKTDTTSTTSVTLGDVNAQASVVTATDTVMLPNTLRLKIESNLLRWTYANGSTTAPYEVTLLNTTEQFGTGAAQPWQFFTSKLRVGDSRTNARLMTNGAAAPATGAHGAGEIVWNRTPASGGVAGWICRVAGTPGTWEPFGIVSAIQGAAQADSAALTASAAVAAPTKAEYDALLADVTALRSTVNGLLAKLRTAKLIAA